MSDQPTRQTVLSAEQPIGCAANVHCVILCGGGGTRLWPLSTASSPKQFHCLVGDGQSMLQRTVGRALDIVQSASNVHLVASSRLAPLIRQQIVDTTISIIVEPEARDTAPAIALVAKTLPKDATLVIMPADHLFDDVEFTRCISDVAIAAARDHKRIVTLGITPTYAATGFGYIECAAADSTTGAESCARAVKQFREKPDEATAQAYMDSGRFFWNAGVFVANVDVLLDEFRRHQPAVLADEFCDTPRISFDHAVMEHTDRASVVPFRHAWSDVGSWSDVHAENMRISAVGDACGSNVKLGGGRIVTDENCSNTLVRAPSGRTVALAGVSDVTVVVGNSGDVLVTRNDTSASQCVKALAKEVTLGDESQRPWGHYDVLYDGDAYKSKRIVVLPLQRLSLQRHRRRAEHWIVTVGSGRVTLDGVPRNVVAGDYVFIPLMAWHRMENTSPDTLLEFVEVQTGSYFGEDDIERAQDDYGRGEKKQKVSD